MRKRVTLATVLWLAWTITLAAAPNDGPPAAPAGQDPGATKPADEEGRARQMMLSPAAACERNAGAGRTRQEEGRTEPSAEKEARSRDRVYHGSRGRL